VRKRGQEAGERDGATAEERERCTFELRRERERGSPLSAMLLSSFNAFVAHLPYATRQLPTPPHSLFFQCTGKKFTFTDKISKVYQKKLLETNVLQV